MTESTGPDAVMKDDLAEMPCIVAEGVPDSDNVFAPALFHHVETAVDETCRSGIS